MAYSGPPAPPPPPPMSGPPPVGAAARPPRPWTVTAAVAAIFAVVALNLIGSVISVAYADRIADAVERETEASGGSAGPSNTITTFVSVGFSVVLSIAFIVLAVLLLRGSNGARIATWAVGGFWLLCGFCGLASSFFLLALDLPGWLTAYSIASSAVSVLLFIAIIVLLLLPASNDFFKPKPADQLY